MSSSLRLLRPRMGAPYSRSGLKRRIVQFQETERLFQIIDSFASAGVAILYVSHRLEEVKQLSHRITILRDGRLVTKQKASDLSPSEIVRLMVGRSLHDLFPTKALPAGQTNALEVRNLWIPRW